MFRTPNEQCADAEGCEDFQTFVKLYRVIKAKEPELPINEHDHCVIYHVEDFPPQCQCEQWDSQSKETQHKIHGHWFHRYEMNKLQTEKKQTQ